jgi:hypothetical protein
MDCYKKKYSNGVLIDRIELRGVQGACPLAGPAGLVYIFVFIRFLLLHGMGRDNVSYAKTIPLL